MTPAERAEPMVLASEWDSLKANRDWLDLELVRLAEFIVAEVPGEPSQSQGAVDTAIRVIRDLQAKVGDIS